MKNLLLNILAFGAIISSLLVITSTNTVFAVIFLISVFFNIAGYLILLGVEFIGISYILLYVGAITVLFLFVIMMINIKLTDILETGSQYTQNFPLALAIGSLFIYIIFNILTTFNHSIADTTITNFLQIEAIGHNLYTYGAALLLICSILLLLAMVATIFISRKSKF